MRLLYKTKNAIAKCNEEVDFAEPSKVIFSAKDTNSVKALNWFVSKRKNFLVNSKNLFIGMKKIERQSIEKISYFEFTSMLFVKYVVIKIKLIDNSFIYLGINKNVGLLNELSAQEYLVKRKEKNYSTYFFLSAIILMILYLFRR